MTSLPLLRAGPGALLLAWALLWGPAQESAAQGGTSGQRFAQTGVAVLPGVGLQAGYVGARSIYTVEGMLYADGSTSLGAGEGSLLVSGGLGAAFRPLGILRIIGNAQYAYDVDVGLRFGPSLLFATDATRSDKNQQFSLFVDPFIRFTRRIDGRRVFFVEAGPHRPSFRGGLWLGL